MQQLVLKVQLKSSALKSISPAFALILFFLAPPALSIAQDPIEQNGQLLPAGTQTISAERKKELTYMVQQDCGSCHGMTLKGGLGPSLLPERVSVLPKQYLIEAVTHGRQGTPMPPWGPLLKQNEIEWIVEQLQLGQLAQKQRN